MSWPLEVSPVRTDLLLAFCSAKAAVELVVDLAMMADEALLVVSVIFPEAVPVVSAKLALPPVIVVPLDPPLEPIVTV